MLPRKYALSQGKSFSTKADLISLVIKIKINHGSIRTMKIPTILFASFYEIFLCKFYFSLLHVGVDPPEIEFSFSSEQTWCSWLSQDLNTVWVMGSIPIVCNSFFLS